MAAMATAEPIAERGVSDTFLVPVLDRWLLTSPLQELSAIVNTAALSELADDGKSDSDVFRLSQLLATEPVAEVPVRSGDLEPQFLGIIPTRACNLRCRYCAFGADDVSHKRMSYDLAVNAVDWWVDFAERLGRSAAEIHFFGGEPAVAVDILEVVVHRARAQTSSRELCARFEIATNGACSEEVALFLGDYFDAVILSFDGDHDAQDLQRPAVSGSGSFDLVRRTARILSDAPAELCLRICITEENVASLPEIVRWFCDEFQPTAIDCEPLQRNAQSDLHGLQPADPFEFIRRFDEASAIAAGKGVDAVCATTMRGKPRVSFCPVGNDTLIVHPDGLISACYLQPQDWQRRQLDLSVGRLVGRNMRLNKQRIDRLRRIVADRARCKDCFCKWSCAGGCLVNHTYPGHASEYDASCTQTRVITALSILREMGAEELADDLLLDRQAMVRLACQSSDRFEDSWGKNV